MNTTKQKELAAVVQLELSRNEDGCEVKLSDLDDLGMPLKSIVFADWLTLFGFRMCKPNGGYVCLFNVTGV